MFTTWNLKSNGHSYVKVWFIFLRLFFSLYENHVNFYNFLSAVLEKFAVNM